MQLTWNLSNRRQSNILRKQSPNHLMGNHVSLCRLQSPTFTIWLNQSNSGCKMEWINNNALISLNFAFHCLEIICNTVIHTQTGFRFQPACGQHRQYWFPYHIYCNKLSTIKTCTHKFYETQCSSHNFYEIE